MRAFPTIDSRVGSVVFNYLNRSVFPSSQSTFLNFHLYLPSKLSVQVPEFEGVQMSSGSVLTRTLTQQRLNSQTMLNSIELLARIVNL